MTTTNALQKQYDKLTPRERFALVVAACLRHDEAEAETLMRTAPRKAWRMPETYGLSQAWHNFFYYHALAQAEKFGMIFFIMAMAPGDELKKYSQQLEGFINQFVVCDAAFDETCKAYGIDPEALYVERDELAGMTGFILAAYALQHDNEPPPAEAVTKQAEINKALIENIVKDWE